MWDQIDEGEPDALESLYRAIHSLSGSGETFGFPKLSEAAKQCEAVLLEGIESGQLPRADAQAGIVSVLAELDQ